MKINRKKVGSCCINLFSATAPFYALYIKQKIN